MKRNLSILISCLTIVLMIFTTFSPVQAANTNEKSKAKILYSDKEITDIENLEARAKQGISDDADIMFTQVQEAKIILDNGVEIPIETYETTQKLLVTSENGVLTNSYVTTTFTEVPEENQKNSTEGIVSTQGSQYDEYAGASSSVRSYSTIYWETKGSGTSRQFRLTKSTGGWTRLDSTVSMSNRLVRLGHTGVSKQFYPSTNSFSYSAPTTWSWLNANAETNVLGCTTEITLTRGTSSWKQVFINDINGYPGRY